MKKLFSIFFVLALMWSGSTFAQKSLLTMANEQKSALQDATEMLTSASANGQRRVSPRANVPYDQATLDVNWAWNNLTSTQKMAGSTQVVQEFKWRDSDGDFVSIIMLLNKSSLVTRGGKTFVANGTYNVTQSSASANYIAGGNGWNFGGSNVFKSSAQCGSNTGIYINSGTMIVEDGAGGNPFVVMEFVVDFSASRNRYTAYFTAGAPIIENLSETWTNDELVNSTTMINWADYGYDAEYVQRIEWYRDGVSGRRPCVRLECDMWPSDIYYNSKMLPDYGTYTLNTDGNNVNVNELWAYPISVDGTYQYTFWYPSDNIKRYLKAGTMQVVKGINGPCLKINATGSRNPRFNTSTYTLTIGTPAYTITFKNYDGTILQSSDWAEGATPSYSGTPTKPEDANYTYEFSGWSPNITTATADKEYIAQFNAVPKASNYTVTYNKGTYGTGSTIANDTKTGGTPLTLSSSTYTRTGYTQTGWSVNLDGSTNDYALGGTYSTDADLDLYPYWTELVTFTIAPYTNGTVTVTPNDGSGAFTSGSRDLAVGTMVSFSAVANTNYHISTVNLNIKGSDNSFSASSAYTLKTGDGTVTLTADFLPDTYAITYNAGENGTGTIAAGEKTYNEDFTLSSSTFTRTGYTQTGWSTEDGGSKAYTLGGTYTGNTALNLYPYWEVNSYSLNWTTDGDALTGTYTSGTVEYGTTIVQPNTPTKAGYTFNGWSPTPAATMPAEATTYTATWNAVSSDLVLKDGVTDGQTDIDFDAFKATYNGLTMNTVTLNRTFTAGNWATICLPFDVDESQLSSTGLFRKVYEFRYATGSADENDQVTFHFRVATSMVAGRGYLVKGTSDMNTSFTFTGVTINTSADTEDDVNNLKTANAYCDESVGSDIKIVGVLRSGTLRAVGKQVMGLAQNKIWYPHTDNGNPMPAYRAYFYNPNASASVMPRVRIVVEGEGTTELEVVDGELLQVIGEDGTNADGDVRGPSSVAKKYIRNGVLIIERNGVRYDAQGKRL